MSQTNTDCSSGSAWSEGNAMEPIGDHDESSGMGTSSCSLSREFLNHDMTLLEMQEIDFRQTYLIPEDVGVRFPRNIDDVQDNSHLWEKSNIIFWPRQHFDVGLCLPLPSLVHQFLYYTQIHLVHVHSNIIGILMGVSVLNFQYNLDLGLEEVFFIYALKSNPYEKFFFSADMQSL